MGKGKRKSVLQTWSASVKKPVFLLSVAIAFAVILFLSVLTINIGFPPGVSEDVLCIADRETFTVSGSSLSGIVEDGESITLLHGYYDCNPVRRGDIVLYEWVARDDPLAKRVVAIPGDTFSFQPTFGNAWHAVVNSEVLTTTRGEPYLVSGGQYPRLESYQRDYGAGIPSDVYMILSNEQSNSHPADSRAFGLVHISDILGKVILK